MFKNLILVTIRHLRRTKIYALINIIGFGVAMAACILVALYIQDELNYDLHHPEPDRLVRLLLETPNSRNGTSISYSTPGPLGPELVADFPEITGCVRVFNWEAWVRYEGDPVRRKFSVADPSITELFGFQLERGQAANVLNTPNSVILTREMAQLLFGNADPIGKTITAEADFVGGSYTVTGIMEAERSHLEFDFLTTTQTMPDLREYWSEWRMGKAFRPIRTYLQVQPGTSRQSLEDKLRDYATRQFTAGPTSPVAFHLQPITRIHLYSGEDYGSGSGTDGIGHLYRLFFIVVFLLAIVCVNYVNLTTAGSTRRATEVGIRKTSGAGRPILLLQFVGESVFLSLAGLVFAFGLAHIVLPEFNAIMETDLAFEMDATLATLSLGIVFLFGVGAGIYPAYLLSTHSPAGLLKGKSAVVTGGSGLRKALLVVQFSTSTLLVICSFGAHQQLQFLLNKDPGYETENILVVPVFSGDRETEPNPAERLSARYEVVKREFLKHPNILGATASRYSMGLGGKVRRVIPEGMPDGIRMRIQEVDKDFLNTYGIEILSGRGFTSDPSDRVSAFILNESAVKLLSWSDPIGKSFKLVDAVTVDGTVIGVVEDFHGRSFHKPVGPYAMYVRPDMFWNLSLKIAPANTAETLSYVESKWRLFCPNRPFQYSFLEDDLNELYGGEKRLGKILDVSFVLASLVSGLGVFGLAAFIAERRKKEVGIRLVLGAPRHRVFLHFIKEFFTVLVIGNAIAWPLAYHLIGSWLHEYAFRTDLGAVPFLVGGVGGAAVLLFAVSGQAARVVRTNLVEILRYD